MNNLRLAGCRSDTLLGYLKALGVLRLVATQAEDGARASWDEATFVLHTHLSLDELLRFFLDLYRPTPIANPWNNGSGFDRDTDKADRASTIIETVRSTMSERWVPYRTVLDFIFERYVETGLRERMLAEERKDEFVRTLRAQVPEDGLPWIDAAISITQDDIKYPYLLGSGGNDGRLDFSVNFAERALAVVGERPEASAPDMLRDSLEDSASARLTTGAAIGQFSARHAGGVNASSGFSADSLVNPWDYILMIEGSLCFRGAVARRLEYRAEGEGGQRPRSVFPFAFRSVAGGYGSASALELKTSRGELWLPVWDGQIGHAGLVDLFRRGRLDLPSDGSSSIIRSAAIASEAAAAAVTMGAALGLREFKRMAFLQRNGLAYTATASGEVRVTARSEPIVIRISHAVAEWVERVRGTVATRSGEVAERLREFYETLFAAARGGGARRDQALLSALARLEFAVARMAPAYPSPLPYLDSQVVAEVADHNVEHRIAAALSSLGGQGRTMRMRIDLEYVTCDEKGRLVYDRSRRPLLSPHIEDTLSEICAQRIRLAHETGEASWMSGTRFVAVGDVAAMLQLERGMASRGRLSTLLVAYSIVAPPRQRHLITGPASDTPIPAAYAVMKLVTDHPKARDARIVAYLRARDPRRALDLAMRRARMIEGLPARCRDIAGACVGDPRWYASALLVPIERSQASYQALFEAALVNAPRYDETERYLRTTFPTPTINER